jgi:hypothetical protein
MLFFYIDKYNMKYMDHVYQRARLESDGQAFASLVALPWRQADYRWFRRSLTKPLRIEDESTSGQPLMRRDKPNAVASANGLGFSLAMALGCGKTSSTRHFPDEQ